MPSKWIARWLVCSLTLTHMQPIVAAQTDLADVPMYLAGRPKPNLMLAVDDSGSMDWELTLGGTAEGVAHFHYADGRLYGRDDFNDATKSGTINTNTSNSGWGSYGGNFMWFGYLFPNGDSGCSTSGCGSGATLARRTFVDPHSAAIPPTREFGWTRSHQYNPIYYNPAIRYLPWAAYNNGTSTTTPVNADPAAAQMHPRYTGVTLDLTSTLTSTASEWTFRIYPGMVLPAGTQFKRCYAKYAPYNGYSCESSFQTRATDACVVRASAGTDAAGTTLPAVNTCWNAGPPVSTSSLTLSAERYDVGSGTAFLMAAIGYLPATYYVRDDTLTAATAHARAPDGALLKRVEIKSANAPFPKAASRSDCVAATCSYAEEIQNFANWFTYYRKRQLMLNAAISQALNGVANLRAGQFTFNEQQTVTMYDVDQSSDAQNLKRLLYDLYSVKSYGGTPTRPALKFMGEQYKRTGTGAPIQSACQFNAGLMITDGFANSSSSLTGAGNYDGQTNFAQYPYNRQYNSDLTSPFKDGDSNTLADFAMKYYTENLRPDLPTGKVKNDPLDNGPGADKNPNLHMNTFALGINLRGTLYGVDAGLMANPWAGTINWPAAPIGSNGQPSSIDELWHATLNGRGAMFSAASPEDTRNAMLDIVDNIVGRDAAGSAVSVSNPVPQLGDNTVYYSSFRSGIWSGDLNGFPIDPITGQINTSAAAAIWKPSPQAQLATRDSNTRIIATYDGAGGRRLRWTDLTASMQSALTPAWLIAGNTGADMVEFLRGVRTKEGTQFRSRGPRPPFAGATPDNIAVLGDIVNAEPVVVGAPKERFTDSGYAAFRAANTSRPRMVYQGANDGMLHAFVAASGSEAWAYMPGLLFRAPGALTSLGQRVGFAHRFYVDGTPVVSDIDTGCAGRPCSGDYLNAWRTFLVGGLGKGGYGYFGLDITAPLQADEQALKTNVVRWEFPNDATSTAVRANIGYSFGKPVIVKTAAAGWVVLASSGYNNGSEGSGGDGKGYLFVLNAATGALIRAIGTNVGTASDPSGLGPISAWQNNAEYDATAQLAYGGDLKGNLWRFDLTHASDPSQWSVTRVATLVDTLGNPQPVTAAPEFARIGTDRYVYVGTGRYLGLADVPGSQAATSAAIVRHSMYGLKDDLSAESIGRTHLAVLSSSRSGTGSTSSVSISGPTTVGARGWVLDLPATGERIVGDPQLIAGALTFTSNAPIGADPCDPQGASYFWQLDYRNGRQLPQANYIATWVAPAIGSRPVGVQVATGYRAFVNPTEGGPQMFVVSPPTSAAPGKRKSWRELTRN